MRSVLIALALLITTSTLTATVIVPADLGQLSREARLIARGRVVSVDARWTDDHRTIESLVTLAADAYLKGPSGETLQFRVPGGTFGRYRSIVVGAPEFRIGQQVIVFLGASGPAIPHVIGLSLGVFRVAREPNGAWMVTPPPIAQTTGRVVRGSAALKPAPLADFEREVRQLAGAAR
jgi:hypothetical protein